MIVDVCYETGKGHQTRRFNDLELALLCVSKLDQWCCVWVDGELWLNLIQYPSGEFEAVIFDQKCDRLHITSID